MDKRKIDYTLYLVTDREILKGKDLCSAVEKSILGGVTLVQLREKDSQGAEFYNMALNVKEVTDKYNIPLIINDRIDIAIAVDAAGVHVGQGDIPLKVARKLLGEHKIIGVSTQNLKLAVEAEKSGADYLGVGALFPTDTKKDTEKVTLQQLNNIKNNIKVPIVGIGGVNHDNARDIGKTGVDGIAVVSAILGAEDIKKGAEELKRIFKNLI